MLKVFLKEASAGVTPNTWWDYSFAGHNKEATLELKEMFDGESPFDTPKPVKLIRRILETFSDNDSIVLDSFAGAGTTGHAVMEMNAADSGRRECLLIQLGSDQSGGPNIARAITQERVQRAARGFKRPNGEAVEAYLQAWNYFLLGDRFIDPHHPPATIPFTRLAPIVFWQATGESMPPQKQERAYLGTSSSGTAVFLLYNGDMEDKDPKGDNALNRETWRRIRRHVEQAKRSVVYCTGVAGVASLIREFEVKIEQMPRCLERIGE
jgi:adenine-specific DNA-methyltransferase